MTELLQPKMFGLPPRTVIEQLDSGRVALVMRRKSRIIMADGLKIVEKAEKVRQQMPGVTVTLKTSAPLCSKTRDFLISNGIEAVSIP